MKSIQRYTLLSLVLLCATTTQCMHRRKNSSTSLTSAPASLSSPYAHMSFDELEQHKSELITLRQNKKTTPDEESPCERGMCVVAKLQGIVGLGIIQLTCSLENAESFNYIAQTCGCKTGTLYGGSLVSIAISLIACASTLTTQAPHINEE